MVEWALARADLVERLENTIGGLAYVGDTTNETRIDHNLQQRNSGGTKALNWQNRACAIQIWRRLSRLGRSRATRDTH